MFKKFKSWVADDAVYMACLLVLTGVTAFGLGRLSVPSSENSSIEAAVVLSEKPPLNTASIIEAATTAAPVASPPAALDPKTAPFVASKSGTKFHKVTCPGAKQIKAENKIYFSTIEEAKAAGYTAAANCPGLE